jgi:hypothetical protein
VIYCTQSAAAESKAALRKALPTATSTATSSGLSAEEEETLAEVRSHVNILQIYRNVCQCFLCCCVCVQAAVGTG